METSESRKPAKQTIFHGIMMQKNYRLIIIIYVYTTDANRNRIMMIIITMRKITVVNMFGGGLYYLFGRYYC
jgi:hypothetical protein